MKSLPHCQHQCKVTSHVEVEIRIRIQSIERAVKKLTDSQLSLPLKTKKNNDKEIKQTDEHNKSEKQSKSEKG